MIELIVNVYLQPRDFMSDGEWTTRTQNQSGRVGPFQPGWKRGNNDTIRKGRHPFNIITKEVLE